MPFIHLCKKVLPAAVVLAALYLGSSLLWAQNRPKAVAATKAKAKPQACPNDDSGLKLPAGFCATVFADGIGHARHMVVGPDGVVYVNTWSGEYYGKDAPHEGGFLVALQDKAGQGKADVVLEGQLDAIFGPAGRQVVARPFHATAVEIGNP
jgi:glucose/arabinose dehydrogenase